MSSLLGIFGYSDRSAVDTSLATLSTGCFAFPQRSTTTITSSMNLNICNREVLCVSGARPQLARRCFTVETPAKKLWNRVSSTGAVAVCSKRSTDSDDSQALVERSTLRDVPKASVAATHAVLSLLAGSPAIAATDFSQGSFSKESYIVTLGLFLISLPGLWSQIKRAPKASKQRKTFEVEGPAVAGAKSLDERARQLFLYFKKYNYTVGETGETITFVGRYAASRGQAAALVFYVFCGLASTALVFSIALPVGGENWYWLTAFSPLAGVYYWRRGTREEEFKVKMVTSDDESTTDILVEGDKEEIDRLRKELGLNEKGKVYVKGIFEK